MKNRLQSNVIINLVRTITMTVLSFITFPYICRVLGEAGLGSYTWAASFVYYFLILSRISIPNIAVRECVKVKDDPEKLSVKVQELFIIQAITTLISFALMVVFVLTLPIFRESNSINITSLVFILSINFVTGVMSFEWVFTALEKHSFMAIRSIIIYAVIDILIFCFVKYAQHIYLYAFFTVLLTVLTVIINLIYLPSLVKFRKNSKYDFKQYLPLLLTLFLISLVVALYDKTDTFILGIIDSSKVAVGNYSVGMKGVEIIITIFTSLSTVFIPAASNFYNKNEEEKYKNLNKYSVNLCLLIVIPAIALMTSLADPITSLISGNYSSELSSQYQDSKWTLIALASLMLTYSISFIIYTQILIPQKKERIYLLSMGLGVILNVGLSFLLAKTAFIDHPAIGVSIATAITDIIILILLLKLTSKDSLKAIFNMNSLKILIFGVIIAAMSILISPIFKATFKDSLDPANIYIIQIIVTFVISAVIYLLGLLLTKEKIVTGFIKRTRSK